MSTSTLPRGTRVEVGSLDAALRVSRVVVRADAFLEREGIARVLGGAADVDIVGWPGSEEETLLALELERPDVLVVHVPMTLTDAGEGIRLARRLRQEYPAVGVVLLGPARDAEHALRLLGDGPGGRAYLVENRLSSAGELLGAICEVASGAVVIDPAVAETLVRAQHAHDALLERLTPRQLEVLALMATGLSNATIAAQLFLTKRGVEKHIREIFARLHLHPSPSVSRRVAATLLYLAQSNSRGAPAPPRAVVAGRLEEIAAAVPGSLRPSLDSPSARQRGGTQEGERPGLRRSSDELVGLDRPSAS